MEILSNGRLKMVLRGLLCLITATALLPPSAWARDAYRCVVTRTIQIDDANFSKATPKASDTKEIYDFIEIDSRKGTAKLVKLVFGAPSVSPLSAFETQATSSFFEGYGYSGDNRFFATRREIAVCDVATLIFAGDARKKRSNAVYA